MRSRHPKLPSAVVARAGDPPSEVGRPSAWGWHVRDASSGSRLSTRATFLHFCIFYQDFIARLPSCGIIGDGRGGAGARGTFSSCVAPAPSPPSGRGRASQDFSIRHYKL